MSDLPILEKEYNNLLKMQRDRLYKQPHRQYVSIGKFEEFINEAMSGKHIVSLFEAANGVGKTYGMANLLANLFWPANNEYFQQPLFKNWPFSKKGRIISYPNTVIETIIPTLKAVFPKGMYSNDMKYETTKEGKRYEAYWTTSTGWEFTIMTYDQDITEFESANLGWFWEDEPPSYAIHQANYSRLRMGGVGFITETPLKGSQWLFDEFTNKPPSELEKEKRSITHAVIEDACIEHGVRGFLDHQRIVDQIAGYDEDELQQRVFGKHHHLAGIVFKKWNKEIHIIKPFNIDWNNYMVIEALDPHPRTPDAVLWVAVDRMKRKFLIEELWGEFESSELAARIKAIEKNYRIVKRLIDPSAYIIDKHTGYQLAADLSTNYQLDFFPGSKDRQAAIQKIREEIDYQMQNGEFLVEPNIHSFQNCERANWEIGRWQWQDWRGITAQFKDPKEKPIDKDDHMIENLGRILLEIDTMEFIESFSPVVTPDWARDRNLSSPPSKRIDPYA